MMWPSGKASVCKTDIMGSNPIIIFRIYLSWWSSLVIFIMSLGHPSFHFNDVTAAKKKRLHNEVSSNVLKFCQTVLDCTDTGFIFCNRIQLKFIGKMFLLNHLVNSSISTSVITYKGIQLFICKSKIVFICLPT